MNRPIILLPFIFVYRMVSFVFKPLVMFIKYISLGFFFFNITLITILINSITLLTRLVGTGFLWLSYFVYITTIKFPLIIIKYALKGGLYLSYFVYRFLKWVIMGCFFPFVIVYDVISNLLSKFKEVMEKKRIARLDKKKDLLEERAYQKENARQLKEKAELIKKKKREKADKKRAKLLEQKKKRK